MEETPKDQTKAVAVNGTFDQTDIVKPLDDTESIFLLKCPKCSGVHFRHAGYMIPMLPYADPRKPGDVQISADPKPVELCVNCKTAILHVEGKVLDVTKHVDLDAWIKTEKTAYKTTGPGGNC